MRPGSNILPTTPAGLNQGTNGLLLHPQQATYISVYSHLQTQQDGNQPAGSKVTQAGPSKLQNTNQTKPTLTKSTPTHAASCQPALGCHSPTATTACAVKGTAAAFTLKVGGVCVGYEHPAFQALPISESALLKTLHVLWCCSCCCNPCAALLLITACDCAAGSASPGAHRCCFHGP